MRKGKTYALTQEIITRLSAKPNVEIIEFSVADLNLPFCTSCHVCFAKGEEHCPNHTFIQDIQEALMACDAVIFTGTTYVWALNAAMKNLIDHFAYLFHRPALFGKYGLVITTSKGSGEKSVAKYIKTVLGQWGINGAMIFTQNAKEEQLKSKVALSQKYDSVAELFYNTIKSKRRISPSLRSIAVHNAFRATSLSKFAEFERDTQYWNEPGVGNRAYPVKINFFKCFFGAVVYRAAKTAIRMLGKSTPV
jgi:multimeric flavodoxin WrbA